VDVCCSEGISLAVIDFGIPVCRQTSALVNFRS
jgi:hypothetical protein